jgi:pyridoxine/pyridoxamine 5'-phosphate oxidase
LIKIQYLSIGTMERQVIIKVSLKNKEETRIVILIQTSKLGAIVSNQSEIIPSRDF